MRGIIIIVVFGYSFVSLCFGIFGAAYNSYDIDTGQSHRHDCVFRMREQAMSMTAADEEICYQFATKANFRIQSRKAARRSN